MTETPISVIGSLIFSSFYNIIIVTIWLEA